MRLPLKHWDIAPRVPSEQIEGLPDWPPIIVQLLWNRGVRELADIAAFFGDHDEQMHSASLMKGVAPAVARIRQAIEGDELVAVYGDFDVDGVTAAAVMREALAALGGQVIPYIPNRAEEGYGVNCAALEHLRSRGVKLVVTVDCGVSAGKEVGYARELGLDIIITDHHQVTEEVPSAIAVINPRQPECRYPYKELAAVGVAFKLAQALLDGAGVGKEDRAELECRLLDLVALGTVADVAPLLGENRVLVKRGLAVLNKTQRPGLKEMIKKAGLRPGNITSGSIGYALGPRLNAAGRLHDALASYQLLITRSPEESRQLAEYLNDTNQERQRLTAEALERARGDVAAGGHVPKLLMVSGAEYPAGVVGLVAGRLMEEFYRPVLVLELGDEESRGSARSIAELDITEALSECQDLLTRFGGHARAAGFTIPSPRVEQLKQRLLALAESRFEGIDLQPRLHVDCEVPLWEANWNLQKQLATMAPFGFGNPQPTLLARGVWVAGAKAVGREGDHLRLRLTDGRVEVDGIAFRMGAAGKEVDKRRVDVVYTLEVNEWNGMQSLQLNVKDIGRSVYVSSQA
ncbi:MAG: single-stranded-DNA-specific exonuclease RecJ [Chloroflexi bacterium]|nr:single-stranded-DNA-specific exonuclease RecJ [Chloroflexota bacterium]